MIVANQTVRFGQGSKTLPTPEVHTTDHKIGTGPLVAMGKTLTLHYNLSTQPAGAAQNVWEPLENTRETAGQPFVFQLEKGQLIDGFIQGLTGMRAGGKRTIIIPPELAYQNRDRELPFDKNSTLKFEIDLIGVS